MSRNSFAVFIALFLCSAINWDNVITKYNLEHQFYGEIDLSHLIHSISTKNYYLLKTYENKLPNIPAYPEIISEQITFGISSKRNDIARWHKRRTWLTWNLPDWTNKKFIETQENIDLE